MRVQIPSLEVDEELQAASPEEAAKAAYTKHIGPAEYGDAHAPEVEIWVAGKRFEVAVRKQIRVWEGR